MSERHLPVHPNLDQLKHQAKDLLREMKREQPGAKLADAQFALARSYGVAQGSNRAAMQLIAERGGRL